MKRKLVLPVALAGLVAMAALTAQFPRPVIDPAASGRGATVYAADCARCHGEDARGTPTAPDMLRSEVILHDRREALHGKDLGPLLKTLPGHNFNYSDAQLNDLSQFFADRVGKILRSGYNDQPTNLLNGDAKAGEAYFNGAGTCNQCHSPTGNLKGLATRYSAAALQQKFLFPGSGFGVKLKPQVTVALPNGHTYTGDVVRIDDFNVTLKGKDGVSRTVSRVAGSKVTVVDPFAAHEALLGKYTDADLHNLTAYLETLK